MGGWEPWESADREDEWAKTGWSSYVSFSFLLSKGLDLTTLGFQALEIFR